MKPLLAVLKGERPSRRPVWFMRQAGRYLPEYRAVREKAGSFLDLCYEPRLASEVTLQPIRRFDLDAAIIFADILVVPHAMGVEVGFREGEGPVVEIVNSEARVRRLQRVTSSWQAEAVCETVRQTRAGLPSEIGLIGFCGAPWTVASYMIEGGSSEERLKARQAAYERPDWFVRLMGRLVEESIAYLLAQVAAGAEVVQIFESWAGDLPALFQADLVIEPITRIIQGVRDIHPDIPVIVFARGVGAGHIEVARRTAANAVSIEPMVPVKWARDHLAPISAVQGNLDPLALSLGGSALEHAAASIISELPVERHIFNLGHGVRPETDPAHVALAIEMVRTSDRRSHG
jgi:uroporphyrinogen decarboxylase